jgi:hypothetical protein
MLPKQHLFLGVILALTLLFIFPQISWIGFFLIVFSTVLIDVDHYIYYIYKKRDFNLKNAYNWFIKNQKKLMLLPRKKRNEFYGGFCFLHGIELLLVLLFFSKISIYPLFIFIGSTFHLILDLIHQRTIHDRLDRISSIYDFLKFKKLKLISE